MPTRILFVDDEPDLEPLIRQKFRRQVRRKELVVDFAGNGREALAKITDREADYDLIITDINMPEMNGLELLSELATLELSTLVLVLSAYGDMANIRTAMNRGAFDFLTKPIDFNDLAITQQKALAHLGSLRERSRLQAEKARLEERARFVRVTFGRYLSDSVVQTLLDDPQGLRLGGEKREVSILMSDLRGFTSLSERLPPEKIVSMINTYFGSMIDIVMEHGGTIDELLGDAMLVIFGAPLLQEDHADRAISCAIAMQRAMAKVNEQNVAEGLPELEMGIAINTGEAVVGNIGSRKRTKYGVVGSHVNLTARIESLSLGQQVLISDNTRRACSLPLDLAEGHVFSAKGFEEPVTVHEVRGVAGDPSRTVPHLALDLQPLEAAIPVRVLSAATSSLGSDAGIDGWLVRASTHHGEIQSDAGAEIEPRDALRIRLREPGGSTLHGKVVLKPDDDHLIVRFSSIPPELSARLGATPPASPTSMVAAHQTVSIDLDDPEQAEQLEKARAEARAPDPSPPAATTAVAPESVQNHLATLGLMIAGIAHDIRSPLGFLINFTDLSVEMTDELSAEAQRRPEVPLTTEQVETLHSLRTNLGKIKDHGTRANELVSAMLDTLRGNRGLTQEVDLNAAITRHLDLFESSLRVTDPDAQLQLDRQLDENAGSLRVAPQDISRILLNLVHNACDASRAKARQLRDGPPHVVVKTADRGDAVELSVWDDGVGIPAEVQKSIFDPFFTTKGKKDGLGLGLALIRELIESSGGTITVHSERGRFTEFRVVLPRTGPPQPPPATA